MAKQLIYNYTFTPGAANAGTIEIAGNYPLRVFQLITNSTDGDIIYNFADPTKGGSASYTSSSNETTLTLEYDTSSMSSTDELQIFVDVQEEKVDFSETFTDPVSKLRVSTPQNLIDTDFEYGLQPAKWETVELVNNVPTFYPSNDYSISDILSVTSSNGSKTINVKTINPHGLSRGAPIDVQGLKSRTAEGKYLISNVTTDYEFSYICKDVQSSTQKINASYTVITPGQFYTGSNINFVESEGIVTDAADKSSLTIKTDYTHGFEAGTSLYLTNTVGKITRTFDPADRAALAPDGAPFVDTRQTLDEDKTVDLSTSTTNMMTGGYAVKLYNADGINFASNSITWESHGLQAGDCLFYYCPNGNTPIGGLYSYKVYMVKSVTTNTFTLGEAYRHYHQYNTSITLNDTVAATFGKGPHQFMLCYKVYRLYKSSGNLYIYFSNDRYGYNTSSGRDRYSASPYTGLVGASASRWMFLTNGTGLPGTHPIFEGGSGTQYGKIYDPTFDSNFVYGSAIDPNGPPKGYDFIEDMTRWNGADLQYTTGYNQSVAYDFRDYVRIPWNFNTGASRFVGKYYYDNQGSEEMYWLPLKVDTSGETITIKDHGLPLTGKLSIESVTGNLQFLPSLDGNLNATPAPVGLGTTNSLRYEKVNTDAIKLTGYTDESGTEFNAGLYELPTSLTVNIKSQNALKNSLYIPDHLFDNGEQMTLSLSGSATLPDTDTAGVEDLDFVLTSSIKAVYNSVVSGITTARSGKTYLSDSKFQIQYPNTSTQSSSQKIRFPMSENDSVDGGYNSVSLRKYGENIYIKNNTSNIYYISTTDTDHLDVMFGEVEDILEGTSYSGKGLYRMVTPYQTADYNDGTMSEFVVVSAMPNPSDLNSQSNNIRWNAPGWRATFNGSTFYNWFGSLNTATQANMMQVTNFTEDDAWVDYGSNGWKYKYESKVLHPWTSGSRAYHGFWAINLWISNSNWTGYTDTPFYFSGNRSYFYDHTSGRFRSSNFYDAENFTYNNTTGPTFLVQIYLPIKTGYDNASGTNTLFGPQGTSLNDTQLIEEIISKLDSSTTKPNLTVGAVNVNTIDGNRFNLTTTDGAPFVLTGVGTAGPIKFESDQKAGVLDGDYSVDFVDDTTIKTFTNAKFEKRVTEISSSEVTGIGTIMDTTVFAKSNHTLVPGQEIIFDEISGGISGLTSGTTYNAIVNGPNYFEVASNYDDAISGNAIGIGTTSSGSFTFTSDSISARVAASGTLIIVDGETKVEGTFTAFKRFLKVGDEIIIENTSVEPTVFETFTVASVIDDNELTLLSSPSFDSTTARFFVETKISARPDGLSAHRPFDGGVEMTAGSSPNSSIVRQTRKYFRYQSGKGIQCSMAINFNPAREINSLVSIGNTTLPTKIYSINVNDSGNGTYNLSGKDRDDDLFGQNQTISIMKGDTLNLNLNGLSSHPLWIKTDRSTGVGNSVTTGVTNNGSGTGTLTWDTTNVGVGTYYYNCQNHSTMGGTINVEAVPAAGTVVTGTTQYPHGLTRKNSITVKGALERDYNGTFDIKASDDLTFNYFVSGNLNSSTGGILDYNIDGWNDSYVRCGLFDYQNGMFFEYDGQELYAVRRSSIQQLTGTVNVTTNSNVINGFDTKFVGQLEKGDFVVIRGGSYRISKVVSNTELHVQPAYKGVNASSVVVTKTEDVRAPRSEWNIDKADGTGPSGFVLDTTKIQMVYIDYSWYGAGKIRFGFKDTKGHVKYMHEFIHNNKLQEAYMRSGNIPARYEIENKGANIPSYIPSLFHWGTSVIMDGRFDDDKAYLFTASANTLVFTNGDSSSAVTNANTATYRYYDYSTRQFVWHYRLRFAGTDASKFTTGTPLYTDSLELNGEKVSFTQASGSNILVYVEIGRNYSRTVPPSTYSAFNTGTTVHIGQPSSGSDVEVNLQDPVPLISIRLAPSVDNNLTGAVGERDIINRMQLQLKQLGITLSHDCNVSLILNGDLSNINYEDVDSPSLSELVKHVPGDKVIGGTTIYSLRASGGDENAAGKRLSSTSEFDLSQITDLGNSVLGGDEAFPNGPDILTIAITPVDTNEIDFGTPLTVSSRITWTESQA